MHLIKLIESLSIASGALVIAFLSAVVALATARLSSLLLRWTALVVVPTASAYILYWLPVWFGGSSQAEYSTWAPLLLLPWSGAGVLVSATIAFIVRRQLSAKPSINA